MRHFPQIATGIWENLQGPEIVEERLRLTILVHKDPGNGKQRSLVAATPSRFSIYVVSFGLRISDDFHISRSAVVLSLTRV